MTTEPTITAAGAMSEAEVRLDAARRHLDHILEGHTDLDAANIAHAQQLLEGARAWLERADR